MGHLPALNQIGALRAARANIATIPNMVFNIPVGASTSPAYGKLPCLSWKLPAVP